MMNAGAGGTQYGVLTSGNQGGGNKKQGLVSTTNTRVGLDAHIRVRGGGHNRNLLFCMNQLGGCREARGTSLWAWKQRRRLRGRAEIGL